MSASDVVYPESSEVIDMTLSELSKSAALAMDTRTDKVIFDSIRKIEAVALKCLKSATYFRQIFDALGAKAVALFSELSDEPLVDSFSVSFDHTGSELEARAQFVFGEWVRACIAGGDRKDNIRTWLFLAVDESLVFLTTVLTVFSEVISMLEDDVEDLRSFEDGDDEDF